MKEDKLKVGKPLKKKILFLLFVERLISVYNFYGIFIWYLR